MKQSTLNRNNPIMHARCVILLLSLILFGRDAQCQQYTYDRLGRVTKTDYDQGTIFEYQYDTAGNLTRIGKSSKLLPPVITVQLQSQTVTAGASVTLSVTATGDAPLSYQWQKNGANIQGATSAGITLSSVQVSDGANYTVVVSNPAGSVTSTPATLSVLPSVFPRITAQSQSQMVPPGANVTLSVTATGPLLSYLWYKNVMPIPGATNATLTLNKVQMSDAGSYFVAVSNSSGSVNSAIVIVSIDVQSLTISTLAGQPGQSGATNGVGRDARFNAPAGVAVDSAGIVYVADTGNQTIRRITPTGVVTTLAGLAGKAGSADGAAGEARFYNPTGIALDTAGNLYVADRDSHTVRKITPDGSVRTLAGLAGQSGSADGTGNVARFYYPSGVTVDSTGAVYVADTFNYTVRKISPGGVVTTLAGLAGYSGSANGTGSVARLYQPSGLAADSAGNLYVADQGNATIRKISPGGGVTTMAGVVGGRGSDDGPGSAAGFDHPYGMAVDSQGNVYVADQLNNTIRRIAPAGANWLVTTLAGLPGRWGSADGAASDARFNGPSAVAVDSAGVVYVADTGNHTIRRGVPYFGPPTIGFQPQAPSLTIGQTASLSVTAFGPQPLGYQWLLNGLALAQATNSTLVLSNFQVAQAGIYSVKVSNAFGAVVSANAGLQVSAPTLPTQPVSRFVAMGDNPALSVTAGGTGPLTYQWSLNGAPIPGATNSVLGLKNVATNQAGSYSVRVANALGSATGANTSLTVLALTAPNPAMSAGSNAVFTVTAYGEQPRSYGWTHNGVTLPGRTAPTLSLVNLQPPDSGAYRVTAYGAPGIFAYVLARIQVDGPAAATTKPVAVTGWNADVVWENSASPKGVDFDGVGCFWFEAGLAGNFTGLPAAGRFTSAVNTNVLFQLQPYAATNALRLTAAKPAGALTLAAPAKYSSLAILAASGSGDGQGRVTLTFADGTSRSNLTFLAPDWYDGSSGVERRPAIAGLSRSRGTPSASNIDDGGNTGLGYALHETDLDLAALGLNTRVLVSVAFTKPSQSAVTSILAISGTPEANLDAPTIVAHPVSRLLTLGANVTNSVVATGPAPLFYQWQFNGQDLGGATNSSLVLVNFQVNQVGAYGVVVRNSHGAALSEPALLTLAGSPAITSQPAGSRAEAGATATLRVTATGTSPLNYQWRFNGAAMAGATNASLSLTNLATTSAGSYLVEVKNSFGAILSGAAAISVVEVLPKTVSVAAGGTVAMAAKVFGESPTGYQWYKGTGLLAGETNPTLVLTNVQAANASTYKVRIRPSDEAVRYGNVAVTVVPPLAITAQPQDLMVAAGSDASFKVAAAGPAPLAYQWFFNGAILANRTNASLSLLAVARTNGGLYSVTVSATNGSLASSNAQLRVLVPARIQSLEKLPAPGQFRLLFRGVDGALPESLSGLQIQWRGTLPTGADTNWQTLPSVLRQTNGFVVSEDTNTAVQATRFYRVMEQ